MIQKTITFFSPNLSWLRKYNNDTLKHDFIAGLISALIMIPQAAALASLAGMPPQYGIYASIVPVIIAALWGSSWHALSGPNTAVALIISAAVFPFANLGTELYISLVLGLTLMVGLIQIVMAAAKFGSLLRFISPAVITGITSAVGVIIIVSAGWGLIGVHYMIEWHFITKINQLAHDVFLANPFALAVGVFTLMVGFALKRNVRKYYLVIAMFMGIGFSWLLNWLFSAETTQIEILGNISTGIFKVTVPNIDIDAMYVLQQLLIAGFAIAVVGAMQATVIASTLSERSGQHIDKNKEILGQGMANIIGSFFLSFAGSSSFNRSIVNFESGAKTPLSAVFSAFILLVFVFIGASIISAMPIAVMSAVLIMVGWGLIDFREFRRIFHLRSEAAIFYMTFFTAIMFGLTDAIFLGIAGSLFVYLKGVINPNVTTVVEKNGRQQVLQLTGHLFFGTSTHLAGHMRKLNKGKKNKGTLVIDMRDVTYIDWAAVRLLRKISQDWSADGGKFILRLLEDQHKKTLGMVDHLDKIGGEHQFD